MGNLSVFGSARRPVRYGTGRMHLQAVHFGSAFGSTALTTRPAEETPAHQPRSAVPTHPIGRDTAWWPTRGSAVVRARRRASYVTDRDRCRVRVNLRQAVASP